MHSLSELQKQQVGLRLPRYLIEQIDEFTKEYNLNRTDIIIESISSYVPFLARDFDTLFKKPLNSSSL